MLLPMGDGDEAGSLLTPGVHTQIADLSGSADCSQAAEQFKDVLGDDAQLLKNAVVSDVVITGDTASAEVRASYRTRPRLACSGSTETGA
jgi:hypothetical protein